MPTTRKFVTSILTLTVGSALVFAQNTPASQAGSQTPAAQAKGSNAGHGQGNHSADHGLSSNKGAGLMVGPSDQQFLIKAAQGGMMEVEAARLGQEKATSNEIKEFARKLEQDHSKANDQVKQLAAQKNVELPADMGTHKAQVDKIRGMSGDQFDKAFMKMQVSHHKKDVNEFQKQTTRSMDSDVRAFATNTLPTLQGHLQQAQELQNSTRGRKAAAPAAASDAKPAEKTDTK